MLCSLIPAGFILTIVIHVHVQFDYLKALVYIGPNEITTVLLTLKMVKYTRLFLKDPEAYVLFPHGKLPIMYVLEFFSIMIK